MYWLNINFERSILQCVRKQHLERLFNILTALGNGYVEIVPYQKNSRRMWSMKMKRPVHATNIRFAGTEEFSTFQYCNSDNIVKDCQRFVFGEGWKISYILKGRVIAFKRCHVWNERNSQHQFKYGSNNCVWCGSDLTHVNINHARRSYSSGKRNWPFFQHP